MRTRTFLPVLAMLMAAIVLPSEMFAQNTNLKSRNTNQSVRLKSAILSGSGNVIRSNTIASVIVGGQANQITNSTTNGVIVGGIFNFVAGSYSTVSGGAANIASDFGATVGGGLWNRATGELFPTIGGGNANLASGRTATIGGGINNAATNYYTTIGGGIHNTAGGYHSTVAGGGWNTASSGSSSTVGGGYQNTNSSEGGTISGGWENTVTTNGWYASVGGGKQNTASGFYATVPGGTRSFATDEGSFVWSGDDSEDTASFGANTFTVRAEGGVCFYTADGTAVGPRVDAGGPAFVSSSDSNLKTKVTVVDPREILAKLSRLPVTEWEYKHRPDRRYIGPMAQDFHAIFGLGNDDKGISTLDSDGVMYAAIQGLVEELKERDKTIEDLKARNAAFESKLQSVEERLNSLPPQ